MSEAHDKSEPGQPLAQRLASMSIAEIDAMSDQEVADLMAVTPEEFATEPGWTWREAAKAATDEYADKVASDIESGQAQVITDPAEIRRRLGGRPRVEGGSGPGPSKRVRVRVTTGTRSALEAIAAAQGRFYDRFEHIVLLTAPLDVLLERVSVRTNNPYGRTARDRAQIARYVNEVEPLLRRGATSVLDGRLSVAQLAEAAESLLQSS